MMDDMTAHNKIQTTWQEMTPIERLCVSVIVQAIRDKNGRLGGSHRPMSLYKSKLDVMMEAQDFFEGTRLDAWCAAMGADGEVVMNGIRQMEGR
mgnify:FL=1